MLTRRQILVSISHLAAAAALVSCSKDNGAIAVATDSDLELLASVTYDLLPYPELTPEIYVRVAQQIIDLDSADVSDGLNQLRQASNSSRWADIPESERIAILASLEHTSFFNQVRSNTVQIILQDPEGYSIVGYGGSSKEYGGYLNRGFNDIDWLPVNRSIQASEG